jgi:hypothetical protein
MGDLGGRSNQGNGAVRRTLRDDVRSYQSRKSRVEISSPKAVFDRSIIMSGYTTSENTEIEELHEMLLEADVVDGPPELRELVQELWPELAHKVKPPISEMH